MPLDKRPLVIFWNSAAGWHNDRRRTLQVARLLARTGWPLWLERVGKGQDIAAASRRFLTGEAKVLIAAGGDGTINALAHALVHTRSALGVIPAGTLNHFARDLSIPITGEAAASCMMQGREIQIDVGAVNGRVFINNSVLGIYPVYCAARDAYERKGLAANRFTRFIAAFRGLIRVCLRVPRLRLHLTLEDGSSFRTQTAFVLIANNDHELERWNIGHRNCLDKGDLWIYILKNGNRWSLARSFLRFLFKRFSRHEAFDIFKARAVRIDAPVRRLKVGLDGEIVNLKTPLEYRSLPRSLRVIAPADYTSQTE